MTDLRFTHILMIVDRSGSMQSIRIDVEAGFDAFVAEQRGPDGRCTLTLVQFDDVYETVYADRDLSEVPRLQIVPRRSTALLDAIGRAVVETGGRLAALSEEQRPGAVIVGIVTDGLENASQEYNRPMIRALIEQQERDYGWTFLYLGANQDAIEVGAGMGIAADRSVTYSPAAAGEVVGAYSAAVTRVRAAAARGATADETRTLAGFTPAERKAAEPASRT